MTGVQCVDDYDRGIVGRCLRMSGLGVFGEFDSVVRSCVIGRNEFWGWDENEFNFCPRLYGFRSLVKIVMAGIGAAKDEYDVAGVVVRLGWLREFVSDAMEHDGESHRIINPLGHLSKQLMWLGHDVIDFPRTRNDVDEVFTDRLVSGLLERGWCTAVFGRGYEGTVGDSNWLLANAVVAGDIVRFCDVSNVPLCFSRLMGMFDNEDLPGSIAPDIDVDVESVSGSGKRIETTWGLSTE